MPESVLIIDDEPRITVALMTRLQACGYEVYHAINGLAGVEAAALHVPDAIILDIRMPDIDGYETCTRIKRLPGLERTPVVFLSANAYASRKHTEEVGGAAYLTKPFEAADVIGTLERVLAARPGAAREVPSHD